VSYRWFYFLLANIALLGVNAWLFVDKPAPEIVYVPTSNVELPVFKVGPLKDFGISSVESFHFPLMEPLPSKEQLLQSQLSQAQTTVIKKTDDIKRAQQQHVQQSRQLSVLNKKNIRLQQRLVFLEKNLEKHQALLAEKKKKIVLLEEAKNSLPIYETEITRVKNSIDSQPDLIKPRIQSTGVDKESPPDKIEIDKFSGSMEFGFAYEQDNQVTRALKGRLILDYDEVDEYNINSDLKFEFENEDGDMSTEKYRWQLQSDYNLDPTNLVYARSDISRSKFSSYEREDVFTVGYGRIFFNTDRHKFNIEIGPGYRFAVPNVGEDAVSIDEFIARTRLNYERVVTDSLQIAIDTVIETGRGNSVHSVNFKAQNRIYQELYLIFNFDYKFTQNVPIDTVNQEVSSGLSLLYAF